MITGKCCALNFMALIASLVRSCFIRALTKASSVLKNSKAVYPACCKRGHAMPNELHHIFHILTKFGTLVDLIKTLKTKKIWKNSHYFGSLLSF